MPESEFKLNDGEVVEIKNISNTSSCFNIQFGNIPHKVNEIISEISSLPSIFENENNAIKAWRYVIENIQYAPTKFTSLDFHHPLVVLNALGYGQCDDLSTVLHFLWKEMGYESRIWDLGNHVVPEVKINNKWQMLDPSFQVFYYNKKMEIAGVEEIIQDTSLILNPFQNINYTYENDISRSLIDSLRYSLKVANYYIETAHLNEYYIKTYSIDSLKFCIPSKASIFFPINEEILLEEKNWLGENLGESLFLSLELSPKSIGKISIPLISVASNGAFTFSNHNNERITFSDFNTFKIDANLEIKEIKTVSKILYKINNQINEARSFWIYNYNSKQIVIKKSIHGV